MGHPDDTHITQMGDLGHTQYHPYGHQSQHPVFAPIGLARAVLSIQALYIALCATMAHTSDLGDIHDIDVR